MKSSVITFPGSNCDRDMDVALTKFGFKNKMVWHNDQELPKSDLIVLPGGFSYGDYLRCGSMASKSKIMNSVINFAKSGGLVMGICNGFQILVEAGLVPGVLLRNKYLQFICKNVHVKVDNKENTFFKNLDKKVLEFHIAHNEGNYFCTKDQLKEIEDNNQIAIYYCDQNGNTNDQINPYEGGLVSMLGNESRGIVLSSEDTYSYWKNLISIDKEDFYTFPNTDTYPNSYVTKKESSGSRVVALYSLVNGGHIYASPNVTYSPFFSGNVQDINTAEEIYSVFKSLN